MYATYFSCAANVKEDQLCRACLGALLGTPAFCEADGKWLHVTCAIFVYNGIDAANGGGVCSTCK